MFEPLIRGEKIMVLLVIGVLLWTCVHLFPSVMPAARKRLITRFGEGPYKGLFALDLVIAILLMVFGWRSTEVSYVYTAPLAHNPIAVLPLVAVAFILMGAANVPTNIKRYLRHPMLTGVIVWGVAHLLANGDNRALVLFGGLTLWAGIALFTISRRDGEWVKPAPVPVQKDGMLVGIGLVLTAVVAYFHEYLSGVRLFG
jgi:uncharacterized membrane protein